MDKFNFTMLESGTWGNGKIIKYSATIQDVTCQFAIVGPEVDEDIYQTYSLDDRFAAHALLDLSAPTTGFPPSTPLPPVPQSAGESTQVVQVGSHETQEVAHLYEADGRSKRKTTVKAPGVINTPLAPKVDNRRRFECTVCGKHYGTSSNLSRHKHTHRSIDSKAALTCTKCAYIEDVTCQFAIVGPEVDEDIYQTYALDDRFATHALLDVSASTTGFPPSTPLPPVPQSAGESTQVVQVGSHETQEVAHSYEADGRSERKTTVKAPGVINTPLAPKVDNRPRFECTVCGKHYATCSNLCRHKQTHRSIDSEAALKCTKCGKVYVSKAALKMHMLTHNLCHACDVCGKRFSRPWLLQCHLRSHTGEKPYRCTICDKAFADRSNVRTHMQTHGRKSFTCTKCGMSFACHGYMKKHLEVACYKKPGASSRPPPGIYILPATTSRPPPLVIHAVLK